MEMTVDIIEIMKWDEALKVGDEVTARWTNSGRFFIARATISKLNQNTMKVKLADDVVYDASYTYPAGHIITVQRCTFNNIKRWSVNNGAFPIEDKQ